MISDYAHRVLNDPALIEERDMWFGRLDDLFEGRPDAYNSRCAFTLLGREFAPQGYNEATWAAPPDSLKRDFARIMDSLPLIGPEAGQRRLEYFRDILAGSRVMGSGDGACVCYEPLSYAQPERWIEESLENMALAPRCADNRFAPVIISNNFYGVHFIDRIFGARVYYKAGQWNADYLKTPVGELRMPDLETDETWALARRAAMAFVEADVALPLFGTPILSSALNILINLYGQNGLIAMLEDEDAARHDLETINALIRALPAWYREHIPLSQLQGTVTSTRTQPPGSGQLCGCTCQLLSGPLYREFIMPLDDALLGDYPHGGMIHLCGAHAQHIPAFREMRHLRALQLNDRACADLEAYLTGLREDQVLYYCPCPEMPLEKALALAGGRRLVVIGLDEAPLWPQTTH